VTDRIVITRPIPGDPAAMCAARGYDDVWCNPVDRRLERRALLAAIRGAAGVLATPADTNIDAEFFEAAGPGLRIVSNYAVGVDNIDLDEARRRGVSVGHTPNAVTEPTADLAWMLILAAARRAREGLDLCRSGAWTGVRPFDPPGRRLIGRTLLIVGAGRIGHATARRAIGWDMRILYHARSRHPEFEAPPLNATPIDLDAGLAAADVVSLHTPLTDETRHLIDARRLALMKPTAVLVNTARGPVVDEAALAAALRAGGLFGAGLDVYEREPRIEADLVGCPNAFLMPHWGSTTEEDRLWMTEMAVDNLLGGLRGERPPHAVVHRDDPAE
jgi:glyoxylate reductase